MDCQATKAQRKQRKGNQRETRGNQKGNKRETEGRHKKYSKILNANTRDVVRLQTRIRFGMAPVGVLTDLAVPSFQVTLENKRSMADVLLKTNSLEAWP